MGSLADRDRDALLAWCDRNSREQDCVIDTFLALLGPAEREAIAHVEARRRAWANAEVLLRSVPSDRVDGALTVLELWEAVAEGTISRAVARINGASGGGSMTRG